MSKERNQAVCSNCETAFIADEIIQRTVRELFGEDRASQHHIEPVGDSSPVFPVTGRRHIGVEYRKYLTRVHGREIIDYDKLRNDNPALYEEILQNEYDDDKLSSAYTEYVINEYSILKYAVCPQCGETGAIT